jgi:HK97 family phage prohead protease
VSQFTRSFTVEDAEVVGDGRTVRAFAAVFDTPAEVRDVEGHYREQISRSAFDKTIRERGTKFAVLFNHGRTLFGTPSDRYSMPIGVPVEPPRVETLTVEGQQRSGLLTVTRYNETEVGEEALEGVRSGSLPGQSFSGRFVQSSPRVRGKLKADHSGNLPLITRSEIAMTEYGPTPFPVYAEAAILDVRSQALLIARAMLPEMSTPTDEEALANAERAAECGEVEPLSEHSRTLFEFQRLRAQARERGIL